MSPLHHKRSLQAFEGPGPDVRTASRPAPASARPVKTLPDRGRLFPPTRGSGDSGFTLIEVVVAIAILSVGLMSIALLNLRMMTGGRSSRYMSQSSVLASEKLEDLNRWMNDDPQVCEPAAGATVGSLAADIRQTTTCVTNGRAASVAYFDDVNLSFLNNTDCPNATDGCIAETVSSVVGGNVVYTTTYHAPDGTITTPVASATPPAGVTFHRRWIIEGDQPVSGVRRITILVTLLDATVDPPVSFQMSMVRP